MNEAPVSEAESWMKAYNAARAAGLTDEESSAFATGEGDLEELAKLVEGGCPRELLARIVL